MNTPLWIFLNREHVAGFPNADQSKLWRDYPGLVLSKEFHDALITLSPDIDEKVTLGISNAIGEFDALAQKLNEAKDLESMKHIMRSLEVMHTNFTGIKLPPPSKSMIENDINVMRDYIYQTLNNVGERCWHNA